MTLIPSVPYLNRWLSVHDYADNPDTPLWPRKSDNAIGMSYNGFKWIFSAAADRAGIERSVTLTNFRKSSASFFASQGLPQAHIEDHHGWTRGSSVAARYVAVFSEDADRALANAHRLDVSESEPDPTGPLECPRCSQQTPREKSTYVWCGQALSPEGTEVVAEQNSTVVSSAASASGEWAEAVAELGALLDEYPFLREAAGN